MDNFRGIGREYKEAKEAVLNLCEGYISHRTNFHHEHDGVNLEILQKRLQSLRNEKYILAVVGEVKAGKSTFINALLGESILQTDVLQCSSAIVEIVKSEKTFVTVKYANQTEKTIYDDELTPEIDEAYEYLKQISSVQPKYRDIPTTLIDSYLIKRENDITPDKLQKESKYPLGDKKKLIEEYIEEYKNLDKIPLEIQFGYPLKYEFDELRLVDSPGVNALGGIQDKTFDYINQANAVLFVHRIEPVESESFRKFFEQVTTERIKKETLFLILTHAGLCGQSEVLRLVEEAKRLYPEIEPQKIIPVDSRLRLIWHELKNGKTVEQVEESDADAILIGRLYRKAKGDEVRLLELIRETSNFDEMEKMIEAFSLVAPKLQLLEILESLGTGYQNQNEEYTTRIEILEKGKNDPQKIENKIAKIQRTLSDYELMNNQFSESMRRKYTGSAAEWRERIDRIKISFPSELTTKCNNEDSVQKLFEDSKDEIGQVINNLESEISDNFLQKMKNLGKELKEKENIPVPIIDIASVKNKARKEAFKTENVYERRWYTLWLWRHEIGKTEIFDEKEYLNSFRMQIQTEFYNIVNKVPTDIINFIEKYCNSFDTELRELIKERNKSLEELKNKKQKTEEILSQIEDYKSKQTYIEAELKKLQTIWVNLS